MGTLRSIPPKADDPGLIQFCDLCLGMARRTRQARYLLEKAKSETNTDNQEALALGAMALLNYVQLAIQNGPETHELDYRVPEPDDFEIPESHKANKGAAARILADPAYRGLSLVLRFGRNLMFKSSPTAETPRVMPIRMTIDLRGGKTEWETGQSYVRFARDLLGGMRGKPRKEDIESNDGYLGGPGKSLITLVEEASDLVDMVLRAYGHETEWPE